jgi:hypothetical protein
MNKGGSDVRSCINKAVTKIYYLYSKIKESKKPIVTVCLMFSPDLHDWARGVAVCSPKDSANKAKGRIVARAHAAKLIAAKHMPGRHLHRVLTDDVKVLIKRDKLQKGIPLQHDYVPAIRGNAFIQSILKQAVVTARNVILSEEDRDLENELNPQFTPHELRLVNIETKNLNDQ